jgi:hypothetical protein
MMVRFVSSIPGGMTLDLRGATDDVGTGRRFGGVARKDA